ncbi:MAG: hypothetical protein AB1505_06125 [Candidatus Latescibacterota bacterium]
MTLLVAGYCLAANGADGVEPSCPGGSAPDPRVIWCDDFDEDRLSRYFEYDDDDGDFRRVAGVGRHGSTAMRARWEAGDVGAGSLHLAFGRTPSTYFRPVDAGTANHREIYWRLYLKHQAGWHGGGADKLSRAIVFASGNWAEAAIGHVWSGTASQGTADYLVIDPASGTDTSGTLLTTVYNDFPNLRWLGAETSTSPVFEGGHVAEWHCIEAHMELNDLGQSNGIFELWIDGQLEASRSGLNWLGSYSAYGINAVFLENHWSASPAVLERYFDNFVVSTKPIGCVDAAMPVVPRAPPRAR